MTIQIIREAAGHKRRWSVYLPAARDKTAATINQTKKERYILWQNQQENMQRIFREMGDTWQRGQTCRKNSPPHTCIMHQQTLRIRVSTRAV